MATPYSIRISSQKGGVGKTTFAVNFSVALRELGYKVILIDSDFVNPAVSTYLGLDPHDIWLVDSIHGRKSVNESVVHTANGIDVVPGKLSVNVPRLSNRDLDAWLEKLKRTDYDFIVTDTQPGIAYADALKFYNEALIIVTPDNPSCINAIRMVNRYDKAHLKNSVVVNMARHRPYELSKDDIEDAVSTRVLGVIPEDELVPLSIYEQRAAVELKRNGRFSSAVRRIANHYAVTVGGRGRGIGIQAGDGRGGKINALLRILHLR